MTWACCSCLSFRPLSLVLFASVPAVSQQSSSSGCTGDTVCLENVNWKF